MVVLLSPTVITVPVWLSPILHCYSYRVHGANHHPASTAMYNSLDLLVLGVIGGGITGHARENCLQY